MYIRHECIVIESRQGMEKVQTVWTPEHELPRAPLPLDLGLAGENASLGGRAQIRHCLI